MPSSHPSLGFLFSFFLSFGKFFWDSSQSDIVHGLVIPGPGKTLMALNPTGRWCPLAIGAPQGSIRRVFPPRDAIRLSFLPSAASARHHTRLLLLIGAAPCACDSLDQLRAARRRQSTCLRMCLERPPKEEVAGNDLHVMRTPRRIRAFINGNTLSPVTLM